MTSDADPGKIEFQARTGGAIGTGFTGLSASWPLVRVTAQPSGLVVTIGPLRSWSRSWADVEKVLASRRGLVFRSRTGFGARISFLSARQQQQLLAVAIGHGVPVERVRSALLQQL